MENLFDLFKEETKEFEEQQKAQAEAKKAEKAKLEESKKPNKKENSKTVSEKKKSKVDPNKDILDKIIKYPEIVLKAYGNELMHFVGEEDIKAIKLDELSDKLINEFSYQEFSGGITWHVVPNSEKTVAYLVATGKFFSKG